jgi:dTDP-glucose 4,6-dehydratase
VIVGKRILVTGGCGFIGSNFVRLLLAQRPDWEVVNLDKLTYAGRLENLQDLAGDPRYRLVKGDICDPAAVAEAMAGCQLAVNFAAETHVDRSLLGASHFLDTDIKGVLVLLEEAKKVGIERFVQISTDEVYGSIQEGSFTEESLLNPRNPYAASKAGGDRLAYAYWATYGVPVVITRASNNYGPYQYPEKLVPLFVTNLLRDQPVPLYGDGKNVRDWLHVTDHCRGVLFCLENGVPGEVYNIAGGNERENVDITYRILRLVGKPERLVRPVTDRVGHDRRYSLDAAKLHRLGWKPLVPFEEGLAATVKWFVDNEWWWRPIKDHDGEFRAYYERQYGERLK